MSQSRTGELENYVKQVGERIKNIYDRLNNMDKKLKDIERKIYEVLEEMENNSRTVAELKENSVPKTELDEFVNRLTESLRELIPSAPADIEEVRNEE